MTQVARGGCPPYPMLFSSNTRRLSLAASLGWLGLTIPAPADTFVLKGGTKLDGVILHEDATTYTLEVKITKGIKDERQIPKADVLKIEREDPSQAAFAALRNLTPTPDVLSAEEYTPKIRRVKNFLRDYPTSSRVADAKKILETLQSEAQEIGAGAIKLNGKIVADAQYKSNQYELDAVARAAKIRKRVMESKTLQALRAFSEMDKDFRNTSAYAGLVPRMQQVIASYIDEVGQSLATLDARLKVRTLGLERMSTMDRRSTETAIRQENAAIEAQFKKETDAKIGWVTVDPFFKPSMDATLAFAKLELTRLAATKSAPAVDGGKSFRDALALIQSHGDPAKVAPAITAAKTALVPPRYLTILEAAAAGTTR